MKLNEKFFARKAKEVAKDLIGRKLVKVEGDKKLEGIITETVAFEGRGKRTFGEGIEYNAGKIYIMPFRRANFLNVSTESGRASCVFIYRLMPIGIDAKLTDGPGKLTKTFGIDKTYDGKSINSQNLYITEEKASYEIESIEGTSDNCTARYKIKA
jgi:3-methyladenine DNA glycosylase Mpg